jgi:hypothetical protein
MTRWSQRMEPVEGDGHRGGEALGHSSKVSVDITLQPKAVAFPTGARG